jgi:hypothetical protein
MINKDINLAAVVGVVSIGKSPKGSQVFKLEILLLRLQW